jgi:hypothetical protein
MTVAKRTELVLMSVLLLIVLFTAALAHCQTTSTITGNVYKLDGVTQVTSGKITFTLKPSVDATIAGSARFTGQSVTCKITGSGIKANDGVSACQVLKNTGLTPAGTYWQVEECPENVCTARFGFYAREDTTPFADIVPTPSTLPLYGVLPGGPPGPPGTVTATGVNGDFLVPGTLTATKGVAEPGVFNGLAYNLVAGGVTDNCTPLTNLFTAAAAYSGGAQIWMPIGVYATTCDPFPLLKGKKNISIIGQGWSFSPSGAPVNGTAFKWTGTASPEVAVTTMGFSGTTLTVNTAAVHGLSIGNVACITGGSIYGDDGCGSVLTTPTTSSFTMTKVGGAACGASCGTVSRPFPYFFSCYDCDIFNVSFDGNHTGAGTGAGFSAFTTEYAYGPQVGGRWRVGVQRMASANGAVLVGSSEIQFSDMMMEILTGFSVNNTVIQIGGQTAGMEYHLEAPFYLKEGNAKVVIRSAFAYAGVNNVVRIGKNALAGTFDVIESEGTGVAIAADSDTSPQAQRPIKFNSFDYLYSGANNGDCMNIAASGLYEFHSTYWRTLNVTMNCKLTIGPAGSGGSISVHETSPSLAGSPSAVTRNYNAGVMATRLGGYGASSLIAGSLTGYSIGAMFFDQAYNAGFQPLLQVKDSSGNLSPVLGSFGNALQIMPNVYTEGVTTPVFQFLNNGDFLACAGHFGPNTDGIACGDIVLGRDANNAYAKFGNKYLQRESQLWTAQGGNFNIETGRCYSINTNIKWCSTGGAPAGACTNGSLYTDSTAGKLYVCEATAWVAK